MFLPSFLRRKGPNNGLEEKSNQQDLLPPLVEFAYKLGQEKIGVKINTLGSKPSSQSSREALPQYIKHVYDLLAISLGPQVARELFESQLTLFKKTYGVNQKYFELLKELPIPVMGAERLAVLNRAELENELKLRIKELEEIKANLEKTVLERTKTITAERNKLSLILSGITDAVIALDLNRSVVTFNRGAERLIGISQQDALGKPISNLIKFFSKDREMFTQEYTPFRGDGFEGETLNLEGLKIKSFNGKEVFVNLRVGQIREGPFVNLGCILTLHDVTQEKKLEEMKLDFVSMAAHELRTPLTALKGYIYVFSKNLINVLNEQQKTYLLRMNIASQRLIALVENLLNVSRIERGSLTLHLEEVDWVGNVKATVSELLDEVREKNQELAIIEPTKPLPKVKVDKFRMNEVLSNLLSNAISYTPTGGKIKVWFDCSPDEVITYVEDNGQGIPKEALPHLFTKFFRVSGVLEQGSKGTGLGLYIAKSIVDLHKGKIRATSEGLGKGSTFSFSIPIKEQVVSQIKSIPDGKIYIGRI